MTAKPDSARPITSRATEPGSGERPRTSRRSWHPNLSQSALARTGRPHRRIAPSAAATSDKGSASLNFHVRRRLPAQQLAKTPALPSEPQLTPPTGRCTSWSGVRTGRSTGTGRARHGGWRPTPRPAAQGGHGGGRRQGQLSLRVPTSSWPVPGPCLGPSRTQALGSWSRSSYSDTTGEQLAPAQWLLAGCQRQLEGSAGWGNSSPLCPRVTGD